MYSMKPIVVAALLASVALVHDASAEDLIYSAGGLRYDVCGYGKIVSLGLLTDNDDKDMMAVEVEGMPNAGQYLAFRGKSVIGIKKVGADAASRELFSLKLAMLAEALASGTSVRILHRISDTAVAAKCNATFGEFYLRVCAPGLACWRPDDELRF